MYPFPFCKDIVDVFIATYPRGVDIATGALYIRDETLYVVFQQDQYLWNKIKAIIKKWDEYGNKHHRSCIDCDLSTLLNNPSVAEIWSRLRRLGAYTDALDTLVYKKLKRCDPVSELHLRSKRNTTQMFSIDTQPELF